MNKNRTIVVPTSCVLIKEDMNSHLDLHISFYRQQNFISIWLSNVQICPTNNTHVIGRSLLQSFLLFSGGCWLLQDKNVERTLGYPWVCRVKQHKFIVYSSEWLFSAGGSWHYLSCPPFPFDLAHLSSAVPGSLLELPPRWLCPLDGERRGRWGRRGRWQRWKGCSKGRRGWEGGRGGAGW